MALEIGFFVSFLILSVCFVSLWYRFPILKRTKKFRLLDLILVIGLIAAVLGIAKYRKAVKDSDDPVHRRPWWMKRF